MIKNAGIVIDDWELPMFERHLSQAGYAFKNAGHMTPGTLVLQVETTNLEALAVVLKAAADEAARTGAPYVTKITLADGSPVTPDHRDIDPSSGQQKA